MPKSEDRTVEIVKMNVRKIFIYEKRKGDACPPGIWFDVVPIAEAVYVTIR